MVIIRGRLAPEVGAVVMKALDAARETLYQPVPPPATVPVDPVEVLRARHDAQGLRVHARTSMPGWLGERLDVGWAIDVLHPLAAGETAGAPDHGPSGAAGCNLR